jgi:hypothetical protein
VIEERVAGAVVAVKLVIFPKLLQHRFCPINLIDVRVLVVIAE